MAGAKFIGFDDGGRLLVRHDEAVRAEIVEPPRVSAGPMTGPAINRKRE